MVMLLHLTLLCSRPLPPLPCTAVAAALLAPLLGLLMHRLLVVPAEQLVTASQGLLQLCLRQRQLLALRLLRPAVRELQLLLPLPLLPLTWVGRRLQSSSSY